MTGHGTDEPMESVSLRMPPSMIAALAFTVDTGEYPNRSEAIRVAVTNEFGLEYGHDEGEAEDEDGDDENDGEESGEGYGEAAYGGGYGA